MARQGQARGEPCSLRAPEPDLHLPPQDALFFLKDFFTSLAAGINPMVPAETSTEGESLGWEGDGLSPASQPLLGPSLVCPYPQLIPRPGSSPASPRKGSLGVQVASRRLQAVDRARPLSSSPSTSGRASGWGPWARLQGPGQ